MKDDLKNNPTLSIGMVLALLLGGGSGAVSFLGNGDGKEAQVAAIALAERLTKIELKIEEIANDRETMRKHWTLLNWSKDELNALRSKHDLAASRWPDLN